MQILRPQDYPLAKECATRLVAAAIRKKVEERMRRTMNEQFNRLNR